MKTAHLIFPHQLYKSIDSIGKNAHIFLIEESLFFTQYAFHKQKLVFHRASMKAYESFLLNEGFDCRYIEAIHPLSDVRLCMKELKAQGFEQIVYTDVTDYWLEKRINETAVSFELLLQKNSSPLFVNTTQELQSYFKDKKRYFQTDFYIHQRKKRNLLVLNGNIPMNGKWSFDAENRLRFPKNKSAPSLPDVPKSNHYAEAIDYVSKQFDSNHGSLSDLFVYPTTHEQAAHWLDDFFKNRFHEFGIYEDAIVAKESVLNHSMLSPLLNTGLLLPMQVIDKAVDAAMQKHIPYNSLEGFVRQIIGWREFIRAVYELEGRKQRTRNYWGFTRKVPSSFYTGTTGIAPVDDVIQKLLRIGYTHHIERLMVLGNFMLLCEFDPNEVYCWFMTMYVDAYDWVMVPNVYGMSQFADGGLMSTKPYISTSNYILKMSHYKKDEQWTHVWDALFWRFMHIHRNFFSKNPRLNMLLKTYDKLPESKKMSMWHTAEDFLNRL